MTDDAAGLPSDVEPAADESLQSLVRRLARANDLPLHTFLRAVGFDPGHRHDVKFTKRWSCRLMLPSDGDLQQLATALDRSAEQLAAMTGLRFSSLTPISHDVASLGASRWGLHPRDPRPGKWMPGHTSGYCPLCLAERPTVDRFTWLVPLQPVCVKHGVLLLDDCSSCGQAGCHAPLELSARSDPPSCQHCQSSLADATPLDATDVPGLLASSTWLQRLIDEPDMAPGQLAAVADWAQLLIIFGIDGVVASRTDRWPRESLGRHEMLGRATTGVLLPAAVSIARRDDSWKTLLGRVASQLVTHRGVSKYTSQAMLADLAEAREHLNSIRPQGAHLRAPKSQRTLFGLWSNVPCRQPPHVLSDEDAIGLYEPALRDFVEETIPDGPASARCWLAAVAAALDAKRFRHAEGEIGETLLAELGAAMEALKGPGPDAWFRILQDLHARWPSTSARTLATREATG